MPPAALFNRRLQAAISEVVRVVTLGDFRKAVQEDAVALLCLLRQARRTAEHEPLEAIRTIAPMLERLGRIAETAFEPVPPEYGFGGTKGLIHPSVFLAEGLLPRAVPRKSEQSAAETNWGDAGHVSRSRRLELYRIFSMSAAECAAAFHLPISLSAASLSNSSRKVALYA